MYDCKYKLSMSYGKYLWCGNMNSPTDSGFTLTNSKNTDNYANPYTYVLSINLELNENLLRDACFYDIYTNDEGLFGYNKDDLTKNITNIKKIDSDMIGTNLKIVFSKFDVNADLNKNRFGRIPRLPIYSFDIAIPNLMEYGDKMDCNICLENVDTIDKYITPCGHLFHLNCIFEYLDKYNYLYPIHSDCVNRCCGSRKIKPFNCVVCKHIVTQ